MMALATPPSRVSKCPSPGCSRPRYSSGGILHSYCGRTHALAAIPALQKPHGSCNVCELKGCTKQRYYDEGEQRNHDFCSKAHATLAADRGERQTCMRDSGHGARDCSLPGCRNTVALDSNGALFDFCGRAHWTLASSRGLGPVRVSTMSEF